MAADTRMLVLGATIVFGPCNGHQLRQELVSWELDWANIKPGSVYSMLTTLTRDGSVEQFRLPTAQGREVAVYRVSPRGKAEFRELMRSAIAEPHLFDSTSFTLAIALSPQLARADYRAWLLLRNAALADLIGRVNDPVAGAQLLRHAPPQVLAMCELGAGRLKSERAWIADVIARIDAGEMHFAGEAPSDWRPADGDPGWAMIAERTRFEGLIAAGAVPVSAAQTS